MQTLARERLAEPSLELVSLREGCAILRCSPDTVRRHMKNPRSDLPKPFKHGGRWFFRPADLHAYIRAKAAAAQNLLKPSDSYVIPPIQVARGEWRAA